MDIQKLLPEGITYFEKAQEIVEFNLGEYHFFFASIYCQCKEVHKKDDDKVLRLLQSALICCSRILGNNHIQTAEVCKDISEFYYKVDETKRGESLHFYEKALLIHEAEFGVNSIKVGNMCYLLGIRYQKLGKMLPSFLIGRYIFLINFKANISNHWITVCGHSIFMRKMRRYIAKRA